jgi:uncharacterized protein YegP (UPF0339 family)
MAKFIVDTEKDGSYRFIIRRDTNKTVATCDQEFASKGECLSAIALFKEYAKDAFYWTHKRSPVAKYHYSEWEKNGVKITTRRYQNPGSMRIALDLIKTEVSYKTPVFHTTIRR